jgi:hypothetical protein
VAWGDHSLAHTPDGLSVPEREGDWQRDVTLQLSRMALGQVVTVAECGGAIRADSLYEPRADLGDHRRFYASDESMCGAMFDNELVDWLPDAIELLGVDITEVYDVAVACQVDGGSLSSGVDQAWLARHFFQDQYFHAGTEDGFVHPAVDPQAELTLDDLGCGADLEPLPVTNEPDLCGGLRCDTPPDGAGQCPDGFASYAGCCFAAPVFEPGTGIVDVTHWSSTELPETELLAIGAVPGESGEFLSFVADVPHMAAAGYGPVPDAVVSLPTGGDLGECGAMAQFTVHEARVRMPRASNLDLARLALRIENMDEGLRVAVNDRVVAFLDRVDADEGVIEIPLIAPRVSPSADGDYIVRLVHVNSCGDARPLEVAWVMTGANNPVPGADAGATGSPDAGPDASTGADGDAAGDCSAADATGWPLACLLVVLIVARRRRGRHSVQ